MRQIALIMFLAFSGCVAPQPSLISEYSNLHADGSWTADTCENAFLVLTESEISDGEILCQISERSMDSNVHTKIQGVDCKAEGHKLSDFSFTFKPISEEKFEYKNSGESDWQTISFCPNN